MTLLIIASVVHPSTLVSKLLGNPLFVYIGKRSYSLYLWHFPIISFVHSHFIAGQIPFYVYIVDIILTVLCAEASYRYIETPFRKEGLKAFTLKRKYKPALIRTIAIIICIIPFAFIMGGAFDGLGKDKIDQKSNSFNTDLEDKYLIRMIPIDKIGQKVIEIQMFILILVHC